MKTKRSLSILGAATLLLLATAPFSQADVRNRMMVSVSSIGEPANRDAEYLSLSGDGRFASFHSRADNLVPNDTNDDIDVFVHDRRLRTTKRVSVTSSGGQSNGWGGSISRDGRYVAFISSDPNLVANDTNGVDDVFVHDNETGETYLASRTTTGAQSNGSSRSCSFSANGRFLVFTSDASNLTAGDTNGFADIFVKDLQTGVVTLASVSSSGLSANADCFERSLDADGRYVIFWSPATNLVPSDGNDSYDVFVRDLINGTTDLISKSSLGVQGNNTSLMWRSAMSDDGRFVVFISYATNLDIGDTHFFPDVYVRDRLTNTTKWVSTIPISWLQNYYPHIDASGRMIVFASYEKTYVYDQLADSLEQISPPDFVGVGGVQQEMAISADGRIIGYAGALDYSAPILSYTCEYVEPITITGFAFNRSVVAGQNSLAATVEVDPPAGEKGVLMRLSSSSPLIEVPATVKIADGLSSRTFRVKVLPVDVPKVESVSIRWGNQTLTATVTLVPLVPSAFQFTPRPVAGGQPLTVRMVMNGVAPSGGKVVMLSDNSDFATTPATATVPAGAPQVTFQIHTLPVSSTKYVTITAAVPEGSKTAHFVIRP